MNLLTLCSLLRRQLLPCLCLGMMFTTEHSAVVQAASRLGEPVADFQLKDYRGRDVALQEYQKAPAVVVAFLGTQCPLAKLYAVRLQELADRYANRGVIVLGVFANVQDSPSELAAFAKQHNLKYPLLKDVGNVLADQLGAERTPEVFLLDANRIVRYQGRVDDQYVIGVQRQRAQREDLRVALDEVLAGKTVSQPRTQPLGCLIGRVKQANESSTVTYSRQISRIFQERCVECHRPGEIGPFTLTSYEDAVGWGEMIAEVVKDNRMPPWHANPAYGHFANDRSLTQDEKDLILEWVRQGCPQGNPAELPEPRQFVEGWNLPQEPDLVIAMRDKPFPVPAEAGPRGVAYQNFWVDPGFTEDRWVRAAEVRPGNRAVVHHIIVFAHPEGRGKGDQIFLFAYVPGLRLLPMPAGAAKKIPAGSQLHFQVHYTPIGTEQEDLSVVGFVFADPAEVTHEVRTTEVVNTRFELAPRQKDQQVTARSQPSPVPVTLMSMSPHMHLRGQAFKYELELPDGRRETLLDIPHYDFNWQTQYRLKEPLVVPAGARLHCTALFDNSPENPANPNPDETVRWGDQSWEEMMIGYFDLLLPVGTGESTGRRRNENPLIPAGITADQILTQLDRNGDGKLSAEEAAALPVLGRGFERVDANKDGLVDAEELSAALTRLRNR